jgi:PKD repeat protein
MSTMKKILTTLMLIAIIVPVMASVTVNISGTITDNQTGSPVPDHAVTIISDSSNGLFYYNTVYTDISGVYSDSFVSSADTGQVFVQTLDCNYNLLQEALGYSPTNLQLVQNFQICTIPCDAAFYYSTQGNPLTVYFTDYSLGNITYWTWLFGDGGSSDTQNPVHTYSQPGEYTVVLSVSDSGGYCYDSVAEVIYVGDSSGSCIADFTYYADSNGTTNGIHFIDQSTGNITRWIWNFGDGTSDTIQFPISPNVYHIYPMPGTYSACLTIQGIDSLCYDTKCDSIVVGNGTDCSSYFGYNVLNLTVSYEGHMNNGQPATYNWNFGDSQTAQGQFATHTYAQPGYYSVSLTTIDSVGCQYTSWQSVNVGDTLTFHQVWGQVFEGSFTMNEGMVMIFSIDSTGNYFPFTDVMTIDSSGIYYFSYVPDGEYYIWAVPYTTDYLPTYYGDVLFWEDATVVVLGEPVNPYNIHLVPAPGLNLGAGNINGHINSGSYKSTYTDKISMLIENEAGDVLSHAPVNTAGDFDFSGLATGTYYLLAELPGCASDKVRVVIDADHLNVDVTMTMTNGKILGIGSGESLVNSIILYPNPVREDVSLVINVKQPVKITLDLMTITGGIILAEQVFLEKGESRLTVPMTTVPAGLYMIRIHSDDGINILQKIVKAR